MKKRLLAILLVIALAVSLLPVGAMADYWTLDNGADNNGDDNAPSIDNSPVTNSEDGIEITKTLTKTADGYEISLEAYVTGTVSAPEARPLDIVLVLDQSGSMSYNFAGEDTDNPNERRQYAMKQAVNEFIDSVAESSGHRLAIVTFGGEANIRNQWTEVNAYSAEQLKGSVNGLPPYIYSAATNVEDGMTKAASLMNDARQGVERVVIVFTDGVPTTSSEFDTGVANRAIETAKDLKDDDVQIYTVGIFYGANPNELYGDEFETLTGNDSCNGREGDKWGYSAVEGVVGTIFGGDMKDYDIPATNRFLNYLSSNYDAANLGLSQLGGFWDNAYGWKIENNYNGSNKGYYLTASDADGLNAVFQEIAGQITPSITAGSDSVLTDTLTDYVTFGDVPEGATSVASWHVEAASGKGGTPTWMDIGQIGYNVQVTVTGKTLNVTGFDYSAEDNVVTQGDNGWQGRKLVVTFPIEINEDCTTWGRTGYYDTNEISGTPAGVKVGDKYIGQLDDSPTIPVTTYKVDYKFESGTVGMELPEDVTRQLDKPEQQYFLSTTPASNKLEDKNYELVPTEDGTWTPGTAWTESKDETTGNVTYTLEWTYTAAEPDLNGDPITIQVYVDEKLVKNPYDYINEPTRVVGDGSCTGWETSVDKGVITCKFDYDEHNCADVLIELKDTDTYYIQGIMYGQSYGENGASEVAVDGGKYTIDNMSATTEDNACIFIYTKYKVEYYLDNNKLEDGAYNDESVYVTNRRVTPTDTSDKLEEGDIGISVQWRNPVCEGYKYQITGLPELPENEGYEVSGWTCNGGTEGAIYNNDNMPGPLRIRNILPADGSTTIKFYATSTEVTKYPAGFFVINPNLVKSEDIEQGEGYPVGYYFPNKGDTVTLGTDTNHKVDNTTGYIGYVTETGKEYYDEQGTDRVVIDGTNFVKGTHYIMPQDFGQIKELYGEDAVIVPYQINNHTLGVKWPDVTEKDPDDGSYASKPAYHIDCYIKNVKVDVIYDANYENGGQYIHEDGATTGESYTVLGNDGTGENQNFKRDGYTFTGWNTEANGTGDWYLSAEHGNNATINPVTAGIVLYAQWEVDDEQTKDLKATVDYKLGDEVQEDDHVDLKATVQVLEPDTLSTEGVAAKTYTGWKLDSITINDEEVESLPATVNNGDAVVYNYVKDESQTKELSYTVQYYKDNVLADTDTVTESVWVNDTLVPVNEEKINTTNKYEGYSFEKTEPADLPETIEDDGVIKVYYTKDPVYTVSIAPADIVAYTGGDGYAGVTDGNGNIIAETESSGLPKPGYHLTLSKDLQNWLADKTNTPTTDLEDILTFTYSEGGEERLWGIEYVGVYSVDADGNETYVYSLTDNLAEGEDKGVAVRLKYTDKVTGVAIDSDVIMMEDNVNKTFNMTIDSGELEQGKIKAVLTYGEGETKETVTATVSVGTGELKVLSATDEQYTNPLINPETGKISAAVPAGEDVTFTVNDSQVELDDDQVSLLVDSVSDSAEFNAQLEEHAANAAGMEGAETESFYLDLVHAENGNVQVGLNGTLTINWPMPSDANPEGDFKIVHYIAMDRNDTFAVDDLTGDDYHTNEVIENDDGTLSFNVDSFSPFVLVYEAKETAVTVDKSASDHRPEVGDRVKYTLVVANTGNTTTDITVSDTLWKAGMTVYVDGNEMTLDQNGKLNIENVIAGAKITITYYYTPTWRDVGRLVNTATVTAGEVTDSDTVTVIVDDGWTPNIPDDDDEDVEPEVEYTPNWLNTDDHFAYIVGYEDGSVRPTANITRAEVATIFFRLLTDEARAEFWSSENDFTDVASDAWYNNAVSTLSGMGILGGYEDGSFRPNASITRAEFVAIATRFFDYSARYEGGFTDVSYGDWYADCVQASADMGLVNGYEDGSFRPNASITRAEACAIVNRVLHRIPHEDHLLSESVMNVWPDNPKSAWYYADMQESTNSHDYDWTRESGSIVEDWTDKLPERDWSALETEWANAYSK